MSVTKISLEIKTLDDLLSQFPVHADEERDDYQILQSAILADLTPNSAYERILAANLIDIEWEQQRIRRWIGSIIRDSAKTMMNKIIVRRKSLSEPKQVKRVQTFDDLTNDWIDKTSPRHKGALESILGFGIDPTAIVTGAYRENAEIISQLERDLVAIETRRRRLFEDYRTLQNRNKFHIPDVEEIEP